MYQKTNLSNGVCLITIPMNSVKSITALVMVATGSRYEPVSVNGVSHFLEHMTFKGTKKRPSSLAITSLIDSIGGSFNAFTSKEYTGFYIKAASEHLNLILDVLSDMLLNSLLDEKELEKEKGVIIEEINMYEDQPQARVGELFEQLLYGRSALARRVIGEKEIIQQMSRQNLADYIKKMYHTDSLVIGVAGDIDGATGGKAAKIPKRVENYFGSVPPGPANRFEPAAERQVQPASLVYFKQSDQAHLCLGVRAYPLDHPDRYVLSVLSTILGGNMSSRLFLEVREKRGLAYYISSGSEEFQDVGYFESQAGLRLSAVEEAIKIILDEYDLIRTKEVTAEELRRAKDYWKGRMILALEDSFRVANFYTGQEVLERKIETPEEILKRVEAVTQDDIQRVAKDLFVNQHLNLAVVGPFKEEGKFDSLLKL